MIHREVMLLMAEPGVGKTLASLSTAYHHPDHLFHYLMADRSPSKLFDHFDRELKNFLPYDAFTFADAMSAVNSINASSVDAPLSNWIIVDTIGQLYKDAVDNYTTQVSGLGADDFINGRLIEIRHKADQGKLSREDNTFANSLFAGLQASEWAVVKRFFYGDIIWPLIKSQCNVIMLCHPNNIQVRPGVARPMPSASDAVKDRFLERGVIPDLHKDVVRFVDTILELRIGDKGERYMYTIKETGVRTWLHTPTQFTDFWPDYQRLVIGNGKS